MILFVHLLPNALQMRVIRLRHEDRVRDDVLYMHEKIIHEFVDPIEYGVPPEWIIKLVFKICGKF